MKIPSGTPCPALHGNTNALPCGVGPADVSFLMGPVLGPWSRSQDRVCGIQADQIVFLSRFTAPRRTSVESIIFKP